jgi:hypothetical protein
MGVGRNFARGRCDGWIAVVEEGSMEEEGAKSVKVGETEDESGYEQQHTRSRSGSSALSRYRVMCLPGRMYGCSGWSREWCARSGTG